MRYQLKFLVEALEEWSELDKAVRIRLAKKLEERLEEPRLRKAELSGKLKGLYKIKLASTGHRLVYKVEDGELVVLVIAVGRRERSLVYKVAESRIKKTPPHR